MNSWQDHLRDYKKSHPKLSLKDAMKRASATYVKKSGAKKQKGGRKLTALEKKQMFPNGVPNMGPFTPNIDGDNWEERDIPNEIKRTFEGMKKTWQDDPTGLVKYAKKVPVIGEAADRVFGGGRDGSIMESGFLNPKKSFGNIKYMKDKKYISPGVFSGDGKKILMVF